MNSVESQIKILIHKVDILYQMLEQLNRKITLLGTQNGCTNHQWMPSSQFNVSISDYYANGEIIGAGEKSQNLDLDQASWPPSYQRHCATNSTSLASSLKKVDLSSPMDRSLLYMDDEAGYPSSEMFDRGLLHRGILSAHNSLEDMISGEQPEITPDIQIQRLTAQLTAAYNRIASLEEQLVAQRIHA